VDETYRDPQLKPQRRAGAIGRDMLGKIKTMVGSLRWTDADVERCLGEYLTEPRRGVVFERTRRVSAPRFAQLVHTRGMRLALPTRMLTSGRQVFINGETARAPAASARALRRLADTRRLPAGPRLNTATRGLLYEWYRAGYIEFGD
jgi:50S ribosomal protein L16 3-hydroxylase